MSVFTSRRPKARKIIVGGGEAEIEDEGANQKPVVGKSDKPKKPFAANTTTNKRGNDITDTSPVTESPFITICRPKTKPSKLRVSYGDRENDDSADSEEDRKPFKVKKSALSRKALERTAAARIGLNSLPMADANSGTPMNNWSSGATYSKEYLEELRGSTPNTPLGALLKNGEKMEIDVQDENNGLSKGDGSLGIAEKFGASAATPFMSNSTFKTAGSVTTSIPDEPLVRLLKARRHERARAAGEKDDYISLNDSDHNTHLSDDENEFEDNHINHRVRNVKKTKASRLQQAELFDDDDLEVNSYVQDEEKLILGATSSSRRRQFERQRKQKQEMIQEALDFAADEDAEEVENVGGVEDTSDSDDATRHGWERDQIRAGAGLYAFGSGGLTDLESILRYQPPNMPPIPTLADALSRLEGILKELELIRDETIKRVEGIRWERSEIEKREIELQEGLRKAGEEYTRLGLTGLTMEATSGSLSETPVNVKLEET